MTLSLSDLMLGARSDERLAELARAGHDRAFAVIVDRYQHQLYSYARRLDRDHAEDIVQQSLLNAFAALRSGTEVRHLRGWLFRIVRTTATRMSITSRADSELDGSLADAVVLEELVDNRLFVMSALSELARLPPRQRDAFVQTAINGRARGDVATSLGISEGAVRQLVHRARTTIRSASLALVPYPLLRWIGSRAGAGADRAGGVAAGVGTAGGGLGLKLGVLAASGVAAGSAVVLPPVLRPVQHSKPPHARAAPPARIHGEPSVGTQSTTAGPRSPGLNLVISTPEHHAAAGTDRRAGEHEQRHDSELSHSGSSRRRHDGDHEPSRTGSETPAAPVTSRSRVSSGDDGGNQGAGSATAGSDSRSSGSSISGSDSGSSGGSSSSGSGDSTTTSGSGGGPSTGS